MPLASLLLWLMYTYTSQWMMTGVLALNSDCLQGLDQCLLLMART